MGKVTLDEKFKKYTGLVPPSGHRFYLTERYGETIISHCPKHRAPGAITVNQKASSSAHAQATALADADLADPVKHDEWLHKWHEAITVGGKQYKTLRGFVIAQKRKKL